MKVNLILMVKVKVTSLQISQRPVDDQNTVQFWKLNFKMVQFKLPHSPGIAQTFKRL